VLTNGARIQTKPSPTRGLLAFPEADVAFAKPKTSTTARGYGSDHVRLRRTLIAQLEQNGSQRCAETTCVLGRPLYAHDPDGIALAHTPDRTRYLGLAHRTCNQREAARRGARITNARRNRTPRRRNSRDWLGG
jgi:hypothetical protein